VHPLKHPATGQHVFTPYLEKIVQPDDVDLSRFSKFVKPSEDGRLFAIARETNKQFVGSTSSVSSSLSMLFFLLFNHPVVNTENLSPEFQRLVRKTGACLESKSFFSACSQTTLQNSPGLQPM